MALTIFYTQFCSADCLALCTGPRAPWLHTLPGREAGAMRGAMQGKGARCILLAVQLSGLSRA